MPTSRLALSRRRAAAAATVTAVTVAVALPAGTAGATSPLPAVPHAASTPSAAVSPAPGCRRPSPVGAGTTALRLVCGVGSHHVVVPAGVHELRLVLDGASGGAGAGGAPGGRGAEVTETLAVAPGEQLVLTAGSAGRTREHGGANGGGSGPHPGQVPPSASGGGGGASDVRVAPFGPWQRLTVAAGGGGGGGAGASGTGGAGGASGAAGSAGSPPGGTATAGGGRPATSAGNGAGGAGVGAHAGGTTAAGSLSGAPGGSGLPAGGEGGAGGGGYGFGGGGAGGAATSGAATATAGAATAGAATAGAATAGAEAAAASGGGGGGGGSDFVDPRAVALASRVTHADGVHGGDGSITVTWTPPAPVVPWQVDTLLGGPAQGAARQVGVWPTALAAGASGELFLVNADNGTVDVLRGGALTVLAGTVTPGFAGDAGPATAARLGHPRGVAVDPAGNVVVSDSDNMRLRVVAAATGTFYGVAMTAGDIYTIAGSGPPNSPAYRGDGGPAAAAHLLGPGDVGVDSAGNVAVLDGLRLRVVAAATGTFYGVAMTAGDIYTVAGGGSGTGDGVARRVSLDGAAHTAADHAGNLLVTDLGRVRVVAGSTGTFYGRAMTAGSIYTVAGSATTGFAGDGGPATAAQLYSPAGVTTDAAGNVVVSDLGNHRVRVVAAATGTFYGQAMTAGDIYTVAGDGGLDAPSGDGGPATLAELGEPGPAAVDTAGNLAVGDSVSLRVVAARAGTVYGQPVAAGDITTVAGTLGTVRPVEGDPAGHAPTSDPQAVAVDRHGNVLVADHEAYQGVRVEATRTGVFYGRPMVAGRVYTVAGDNGQDFTGDGGPALQSQLAEPDGLAVDPAGNVVISDAGNMRVRVVAETTGTFYGRAMTAGDIYTVAGNGDYGDGGDGGRATDAALAYPTGVAVDAAGNTLIADNGNNRIRLVAETTGTFYGQAMTAGDIYTVAGAGFGGDPADGAPATSAHVAPVAVDVDAAGNIVEFDQAQVVRVVAASTGVHYGVAMTTGRVYTVAGNGIPTYNGDGIPARSASVNFAGDLSHDASGNLVVGDTGNSRVRVVAARTGTFYGVAMTAGDIYTVAGNGTPGDAGDGGPARACELLSPGPVAVDRAGDILVVANQRVREVHPAG